MPSSRIHNSPRYGRDLSVGQTPSPTTIGWHRRRDALHHGLRRSIRNDCLQTSCMYLTSHRVTLEEDGVETANLVFLLLQYAQERLTHLAKTYIAMGYEVDTNSSPTYIKLSKDTNVGRLVTIRLRSQPFDDNKRFYAPNLTIYDNT